MQPGESIALSRVQWQAMLVVAAAVPVLSLAAGLGLGLHLAAPPERAVTSVIDGGVVRSADTKPGVAGSATEDGVALLELASPVDEVSVTDARAASMDPEIALASVDDTTPEPAPAQVDPAAQEPPADPVVPTAPDDSVSAGSGVVEASPPAGQAAALLEMEAAIAAGDDLSATPAPATAVEATGDSRSVAASAAGSGPAATSPKRTTRPATADLLARATPDGRFVVQAGVFGSEANARRMREELRRRGVASSVVEDIRSSGAPNYLVLLGRFTSWQDAEQLRLRLAKEKRIEVFSRRLGTTRGARQIAAL